MAMFRKQGPDKADNPWHTVSETTAYENKWIQVSHHEVITPGGTQGIYGKVHFKNVAIGIVPLDQEGNTWLVGQYRYTLNQYSWEIVEGGGPLNEPLLQSAQRELLEETGLIAETWTPLMELHLSNSVSDEYGVLYVATDLTQGVAEPEITEQLEIRKLPFLEAYDMVLRGDITDALSIAAILKVKLLHFS
jgi:ADP-ribose pyrophosphatase